VESCGSIICTAAVRDSPVTYPASGATRAYSPFDSGGVESLLSSGCSGLVIGSRTFVASNSVTTVMPGTGSSIALATTVSTARVVGGFIGLTFSRAILFAPVRLGLALAKRLLGVGFAAVRFAPFAPDFEALRVAPRAVDFRLRAVFRFFRRAIIAACSNVGRCLPRSVLT
jgi:hypothetical protein